MSYNSTYPKRIIQILSGQQSLDVISCPHHTFSVHTWPIFVLQYDTISNVTPLISYDACSKLRADFAQLYFCDTVQSDASRYQFEFQYQQFTRYLTSILKRVGEILLNNLKVRRLGFPIKWIFEGPKLALHHLAMLSDLQVNVGY